MNLNKAPAVSNCRNEMHFFFLLADLTERRLIYPHEELSAGSPVPLIYSLHCSAGYWPVIYCKWSRWYEMGEIGLSYLFIYFSIKRGASEQRFKGSEGSDALTVPGPRRRSNIALLSTVSLGIQRQTAGVGSRCLTLKCWQVFTNDNKTVKRPIYMHMKVTSYCSFSDEKKTICVRTWGIF